jgi:hypothetical protein
MGSNPGGRDFDLLPSPPPEVTMARAWGDEDK